MIKRDHSLDVARTMFIGDLLDTDIKFVADTGMMALLFMTGVTTDDKISQIGEGSTSEPIPNAVLSHVRNLL